MNITTITAPNHKVPPMPKIKAIGPAKTYPKGIRQKEPKASYADTRESISGGTARWSVLSQTTLTFAISIPPRKKQSPCAQNGHEPARHAGVNG
ncbi:hypothetical protein Amme_457_007 [Acidomonas methanolica NBRC 104435]|uniref:Uncharacterized protein n=1 Tax=Acidomonas methanolica NBRC 104435 TaxID=1231351 RepID=A0A023D9J6_ACIMT|nr:hypothetical protein Amme_457_007 [Acidomonas methanolica NBRC 104435]GEL00680.1 hypothetical protein AME01nite_31780 [Acidomonas methanolica NBRC 104435]